MHEHGFSLSLLNHFIMDPFQKYHLCNGSDIMVDKSAIGKLWSLWVSDCMLVITSITSIITILLLQIKRHPAYFFSSWNFLLRTVYSKFLFINFVRNIWENLFLKTEIPSVWNILKFHSIVFVLNFSFPLSISQKKLWMQFTFHYYISFLW